MTAPTRDASAPVMPNFPDGITREQLREAMAALGLTGCHVTGIETDQNEVKVTALLKTKDGSAVIVGTSLARIVVTYTLDYQRGRVA